MTSSQEYNKKYYAAHKDDIKKQMFAVEECSLCHRKCNHQNMSRHKKSQLCFKNREVVKQVDAYDLLAMISSLKSDIKTMSDKFNHDMIL